MTLKKGLTVTLAPDPKYTTRSTTPTFACPRCCGTEEDVPLVPYHEEDGAFVLCWSCHGFLVGPPDRRLCNCQEPGPASPAEAERLHSLEALRDALAETHRMRLFKVLRPTSEKNSGRRA